MHILTVFAHPDDESFGPAGALAKYAAAGHRLSGLWLTRGEGGEATHQPPPAPEELAVLRARDLREAAGIIGYGEVDLRAFPDGGLADLPAGQLEQIVAETVRRLRPDVMLTFGPGGISGHTDHIALSTATTAVFHNARADRMGLNELYYSAVREEIARERNLEGLPDGNPNTFVDVAEFVALHKAALACHARHVADARELLDKLAREPRTVATFYRAWPPVADGRRISGFLMDGA